MSNRIYHEACGQPTEYSLTKPKFCASCGGAFDSTPSASRPQQTAKAAAPAPQPQRTPRHIDDDDDDYGDSDFVPPRKLEVQIETSDEPKIHRIPLSSIASQAPSEGWGGERQVKKMTKKAVKAKYQEIFQRLNSRSTMSGALEEDND